MNIELIWREKIFLYFSVNNLKAYLEKLCKIPCEKQVLLISGGQCLDPEKEVYSYTAGTDTNPIFLFNKTIIESDTPPSSSMDMGSDFGKLFDILFHNHKYIETYIINYAI